MIEIIAMIGLICSSQGCRWVPTDMEFQTMVACEVKAEDYRHKTAMYFDLRCEKSKKAAASS